MIDSLLKSVSFFLECAKNKKKISKHLFKTSGKFKFFAIKSIKGFLRYTYGNKIYSWYSKLCKSR